MEVLGTGGEGPLEYPGDDHGTATQSPKPRLLQPSADLCKVARVVDHGLLSQPGGDWQLRELRWDSVLVGPQQAGFAKLWLSRPRVF